MNEYVPLWCKSHYSFLEGASSPEELVAKAQDLGLPALALTDRDGLYGAVRAHLEARKRVGRERAWMGALAEARPPPQATT